MESGKDKKILAVDIGNTSVAAGIFSKRGELLLQIKFPTHSFGTTTQWEKNFNRWLKSKRVDIQTIETAIICSVVPRSLRLIHSALKDFLYADFHAARGNKGRSIPRSVWDRRFDTPHSALRTPQLIVVGRDIQVPIPNRYRNPKQVGQDRLVNAYSGYRQYEGPLIIVDFGTAVTFDIVSKKGEYLGGSITPGLEIARDSLVQRTALLPRAAIVPPQKIIGKTTQQSIQSGLFYGWGALTDGVVAQLKMEIGPAKVILTGGQAELMAPFIKSTNKVNPHLTLQGLFLIATK